MQLLLLSWMRARLSTKALVCHLVDFQRSVHFTYQPSDIEMPDILTGVSTYFWPVPLLEEKQYC